MENRAFRKFEWSVWKLLGCRILHQIPKGFWEPWAAPKPPAVSNEPPSENFCLRACMYIILPGKQMEIFINATNIHPQISLILLNVVSSYNLGNIVWKWVEVDMINISYYMIYYLVITNYYPIVYSLQFFISLLRLIISILRHKYLLITIYFFFLIWPF